jgi:hypothetical protein
MKRVRPQAEITPTTRSRDESIIEENDLLSDVRTAMMQVETAKGISNRDAKAELRRRFAR